MKMNLGPFTTAEQELLVKPQIGLERKVYFAPVVCHKLGVFRASGAAAGVYTPAGGPQIPVGGADVVGVIVSPGGAKGVGAMSVTFDVVLADDAVDTATVDFTVPTYLPHQGNVWGVTITRDLIPDTPANAAKKIKTITGFDSCANLASGIQVALYSVPDEADYVFIENTTSLDLPSDVPTQVVIPEGYDPSAHTKIGRSETGTVSVGYRYKGVGQQLSRFNGVYGTLRIDVDYEEQVIGERALYTGFRPVTNTPSADGNAEVEATATGMYKDMMKGYGLQA